MTQAEGSLASLLGCSWPRRLLRDLPEARITRQYSWVGAGNPHMLVVDVFDVKVETYFKRFKHAVHFADFEIAADALARDGGVLA